MPGFDPALLLELIEAERASMMLVVPTMLSILVEHPDAAARDLSSLSSFLIGGSACSAALSRLFEVTDPDAIQWTAARCGPEMVPFRLRWNCWLPRSCRPYGPSSRGSRGREAGVPEQPPLRRGLRLGRSTA